MKASFQFNEWKTQIQENSLEDRGRISSFKTAKAKGLCVGQRVSVGGSYSETSGEIIGLSDDIPYEAFVELSHASGGATSCWIATDKLCFSGWACNREYTKKCSSTLGTTKEKGLQIHQRVKIIGGSRGVESGKIVGLSDDIPYAARVECIGSGGCWWHCWIKADDLVIKDAVLVSSVSAVPFADGDAINSSTASHETSQSK